MTWIGVELGGRRVTTVAVDGEGASIGRLVLRTPLTGDRLEVLDVLETGVRSVADDAGVALADVGAVGVATPGMVVGGTIGGASNVPGWSERFSLSEMIGERVGRPIRLVNDVTAAAVAEHRFGAAMGQTDALVVSVGTGVGAGLVLNGSPYEGGHGGAGEFGHTVVVHRGAMCPCGRRGCVEAYTGRRALNDAARVAASAGQPTVLFDTAAEQGHGGDPSAGDWKLALDAGDEVVGQALREAIDVLGAGIASAVNLLDLDLVVLGGGMVGALGDWYRHRVESAMRPHLFLQPPTVKVAPAQLGADAGALGAAVMAHDHASA
jgi:glucokinase